MKTGKAQNRVNGENTARWSSNLKIRYDLVDCTGCAGIHTVSRGAFTLSGGHSTRRHERTCQNYQCRTRKKQCDRPAHYICLSNDIAHMTGCPSWGCEAGVYVSHRPLSIVQLAECSVNAKSYSALRLCHAFVSDDCWPKRKSPGNGSRAIVDVLKF